MATHARLILEVALLQADLFWCVCPSRVDGVDRAPQDMECRRRHRQKPPVLEGHRKHQTEERTGSRGPIPGSTAGSAMMRIRHCGTYLTRGRGHKNRGSCRRINVKSKLVTHMHTREGDQGQPVGPYRTTTSTIDKSLPLAQIFNNNFPYGGRDVLSLGPRTPGPRDNRHQNRPDPARQP